MLIFFHVMFMFIAFALTAGTGILITFIADSAEPRAILVAARAMRPLAAVGGISLLIGILLGFGAASMLHYPLTSTWLVVTYICAAAIIIMGFAIHQPWGARLRAAAENPADTAKLASIVKETAPRIAGPLSGILWLVIIAMMTLKP